MKPKDARKLLNCSYTTLHNYVKSGKIKLSNIPGKQQDYDEESVVNLYNRRLNTEKINNTVHIFLNNQKYEFKANYDLIKKIFTLISDECTMDNSK